MTFNRNKNEDRRNTQNMLNKYSNKLDLKNWLGHTGACSKIDAMLLHGASITELLKSGRKRSAIHAHLNHLKTEHGLNIVNVDNVHSFSRLLDSDKNREVKKITKNKTASEQLFAVIRPLAEKKRSYLESLKKECHGLDREDFIWHYLLQSFSTMGRASGWYGLIGNEKNYQRITYKALEALSSQERRSQVELVCSESGIRMPNKKTGFILGCFKHVQGLGGLQAAKDKLLSQSGRESKISFLQTFPGIGPKYARNIMMDVYHEDFRDSIAIDARINSISEILGLDFNSYSQYESFYLKVAKDIGINGWELDRLLFNFNKEIKLQLYKNKGST